MINFRLFRFLFFLFLGFLFSFFVFAIKPYLLNLGSNNTLGIVSIKNVENRVLPVNSSQSLGYYSFSVTPNWITNSTQQNQFIKKDINNIVNVDNLQKPSDYNLQIDSSPYSFSKDTGKNNQVFSFVYMGFSNQELVFFNSSNFDLNNVYIKLIWESSKIDKESIYYASSINAGLYFRINPNSVVKASVPFLVDQKIKSIQVEFTDNAGINYIL